MVLQVCKINVLYNIVSPAYLLEKRFHHHGYDHFFVIFLDEESNSGIHLYPLRLDFALPDDGVIQYLKKTFYG